MVQISREVEVVALLFDISFVELKERMMKTKFFRGTGKGKVHQPVKSAGSSGGSFDSRKLGRRYIVSFKVNRRCGVMAMWEVPLIHDSRCSGAPCSTQSPRIITS
jgi:hypothetical protein